MEYTDTVLLYYYFINQICINPLELIFRLINTSSCPKNEDSDVQTIPQRLLLTAQSRNWGCRSHTWHDERIIPSDPHSACLLIVVTFKKRKLTSNWGRGTQVHEGVLIWPSSTNLKFEKKIICTVYVSHWLEATDLQVFDYKWLVPDMIFLWTDRTVKQPYRDKKWKSQACETTSPKTCTILIIMENNYTLYGLIFFLSTFYPSWRSSRQ